MGEYFQDRSEDGEYLPLFCACVCPPYCSCPAVICCWESGRALRLFIGSDFKRSCFHFWCGPSVIWPGRRLTGITPFPMPSKPSLTRSSRHRPQFTCGFFRRIAGHFPLCILDEDIYRFSRENTPVVSCRHLVPFWPAARNDRADPGF